MLALPSGVRVFVYREATDMRKAFAGLGGIVIDFINEDPQSGHLFVFFNRRRDRVKILCWDGKGYWLHYKRLESGKFPVFDQASESEVSFVLSGSDLLLILEGIDLRGASRRNRFCLKEVLNSP